MTSRRSWTTDCPSERSSFSVCEGVEGEVARNDYTLPVAVGYIFVPFFNTSAQGLRRGERDGGPACGVGRKD